MDVSGSTMLPCKIYRVVQELHAFSLTDHGRTDSHSDDSVHLRVMKFTHIQVQLDMLNDKS